MKKIMLLVGAALMGLTMNAQRFDLGANFMLGLPMGDYGIGDSESKTPFAPGLGLGGGIEANYWFNDNISAGLEVGFISFGEEEVREDGQVAMSSGQVIPIILKGEYHFLEGAFRPFAGIGVGYGIMSRSMEQNVFGSTLKATWDQNGLIISPRVGALYQVSDMLAINLSHQYNLMMNEVDGDWDPTIEYDGPGEIEFDQDAQFDVTNYLGVNIGVLFTLFE